ncbi:MAG: RNA polymerase sigma factor [Planctomycetaceae bacterium]
MTNHAENRRIVERACVEFERDLRAFLLGVLKNVHLTEDALQRTAVRAIESSADVNVATVRGWLFRIALNEARGLKRKSNRREQVERAVWEARAEQAADENNGFGNLVTEEARRSVQQAIKRLNPDYREVVIRRIQHEQTFAEIAEDLNRPLGTILTWMRRAISELKDMPEIRRISDEI